MSGKPMQTIVARRTPDVESLLQQLWSLRPELADKNKVTILLALAALLRESQRMLSLSASAADAGPVKTVTVAESNAARPIAVADVVDSEGAAAVPTPPEADEWDL